VVYTHSVNIDLSYLKQQSKRKIRKYIDETLPEEYEKCLVGITSILREYFTEYRNKQKGKDTRIVIGKRILFYENRFIY